MKYVIYEAAIGYLIPVVFPDCITHSHIGEAIQRDCNGSLRSAGFLFFRDDILVISEDGSTSLRIGPQPGDEIILRLFLSQGLSGLDLQNMLSFLAIQSQSKEKTKHGGAS